MQIRVTSLNKPRWANKTKTAIDCEITTLQYGDEVLPFTASPNDVEPHSRRIFFDIVAGNYGLIAKYIEPVADEPLENTEIVLGTDT
jgi:hypothetical protein